MTSSIDFKEATAFACGTPERNAEKPKETTLVAAIAEMAKAPTKRETPIITKTTQTSR